MKNNFWNNKQISVVSTETILSSVQLAYWFLPKQQKRFVIDHRQKNVEIAKDCLWIELQNYCVESTEKKISLSADWL